MHVSWIVVNMSHLAAWVNQTSSLSGLPVGLPSLRRTTLASEPAIPWFNVGRHNANAGKLKRKKDSEEFTESTKKKLRERETSDSSDSGECWSDYERVPGTKAGEKGSCQPKGSKKKKKKKKTENSKD